MKLAVAILLALSGVCQAAPYTSGEGHQYDLKCTANGYSLKARFPVSRFVGQGAGTRTVSERETLALGRSCDAYLKAYGYGEWCWANGGFAATFSAGVVGFPRQELFCAIDPPYYGNCRC